MTSLQTNRSLSPSASKSQAVTPIQRPSQAAMPEGPLISANVPSPTFRYNVLGTGA